MNIETELGIHERDAEIERLTDALKTCRELRQWDRAAVIEECARVAEWGFINVVHTVEVRRAIAAAIRALKDT